MASKNLLFHLLDTQARDIRIESETEESKNIVYEPIHSNSDSEDEGGIEDADSNALMPANKWNS